MRLFVAVSPPEEARADLAAALSRAPELFAGVRPVRREQWHLTLAFLDEVPDERLHTVWSALEHAAATVGPLRLRITGAGSFGHERAVVWAGLAGDTDGLRRLADVLRDKLRACAVPVDTRPYRPHLTLARGVDLRREPAVAALAELRSHAGPWWTVRQMNLVRSRLGGGPGGSARHDVLGGFDLGGGYMSWH